MTQKTGDKRPLIAALRAELHELKVVQMGMPGRLDQAKRTGNSRAYYDANFRAQTIDEEIRLKREEIADLLHDHLVETADAMDPVIEQARQAFIETRDECDRQIAELEAQKQAAEGAYLTANYRRAALRERARLLERQNGQHLTDLAMHVDDEPENGD